MAGRPPKFVGKHLAHVRSLLRIYGCTMTMQILAARSSSHLGQMRNTDLFPKAVQVSVPTLSKIGERAEIVFARGRVNPIQTKRQRREVVRLVRAVGAVQAVSILASNERNKTIFPEPVAVCAATLRKIASQEGIKLSRGRRKAA